MEISSQKWVSSSTSSANEGKLVLHNPKSIFTPVWKNHANLISIFGRARQGKSFMMNCLAGERNVFKVSNHKESCTQGIDISNKWISVDEFSRLDSGLPITKGNAITRDIRVGFVDAEGQGDKDISYDANLICPILLASKCVIFNWKGDLQKDHILSTLGIMTRAAKNVASESSTTAASTTAATKKFGHLHIVFRDWQAVDTDANALYNDLFKEEKPTKDSQTRNQIRQDIHEAFESIHVWLFDAPTDSVADLRQVLTIEKTTTHFRSQVRSFRQCLSEQLSTPMYFANMPLTGKSLYTVVNEVTQTLNRGDAILPSSTFMTMMKEEVNQVIQSKEEALKTQINALLSDIQHKKRHVCPLTGPENPFAKCLPPSVLPAKAATATVEFYFTEREVGTLYDETMAALLTDYEQTIREIINLPTDVDSANSYQSLFQDSMKRFQNTIAHEKSAFLTNNHRHFTTWLRAKRQMIEKDIENDFASLQKVSNLPVVVTINELKAYLEALQDRYLSEINHQQIYTGKKASNDSTMAVAAEVEDILQILHRFFASHSSGFLSHYTGLFNKLQEKANVLLENACQQIDQAIDDTLNRLVIKYSRGFSKDLASKEVDTIYNELKANMFSSFYNYIDSNYSKTKRIPAVHPIFTNELDNSFFEYCAHLAEKLTQSYCLMKEATLAKVLSHSQIYLQDQLTLLSNDWEVEFQAYLADIQNATNLQQLDAKQLNYRDIMNQLDQLLQSVWQVGMKEIAGWIFADVSREQAIEIQNGTISPDLMNYLLENHQFAKKLMHLLTTNMEVFRNELKVVLESMEGMKENQRQDILKQQEIARQKAIAAAEEEARQQRLRQQKIEAEQEAAFAAEQERLLQAKIQQQAELEADIAMKELNHHRRSSAATVKMVASDDEEDFDDMNSYEDSTMMEEDDFDDSEEESAAIAAKKAARLSAAEQRQRAKEWSQRILGLNFDKKKKKPSSSSATGAAAKGSVAKGKRGAAAPAPKKSLAEQREAARQYAFANFGSKAVEVSDDEEDTATHRTGNASTAKTATNSRRLSVGGKSVEVKMEKEGGGQKGKRKRSLDAIEAKEDDEEEDEEAARPTKSRRSSLQKDSSAPSASASSVTNSKDDDITRRTSEASSGRRSSTGAGAKKEDALAEARRQAQEAQLKMQQEAAEIAAARVRDRKSKGK